jgi:hypothetical protein
MASIAKMKIQKPTQAIVEVAIECISTAKISFGCKPRKRAKIRSTKHIDAGYWLSLKGYQPAHTFKPSSDGFPERVS